MFKHFISIFLIRFWTLEELNVVININSAYTKIEINLLGRIDSSIEK